VHCRNIWFRICHLLGKSVFLSTLVFVSPATGCANEIEEEKDDTNGNKLNFTTTTERTILPENVFDIIDK
jgi:hypothetical protein